MKASQGAESSCRCDELKSIRKTKQRLTHPAQHPWLSPVRLNLQVCEQMYDELHVQMKFFSQLFADLQAEVHANVQSWNERRIPFSAAYTHMIEDTQGPLARQVCEQKIPVIRMEYTTLDACIRACRYQKELAANAPKFENWPYVNVMTCALPVIYIGELKMWYDYEVDDAEENANLWSESPTVWSAEIQYQFNKKVSMCHGHTRLTEMKARNTGEAMQEQTRQHVLEQWWKQDWPEVYHFGSMVKNLWELHTHPIRVRESEVGHLMVYNKQAMSLILDLMRLLHDMQLLPENTCI